MDKNSLRTEILKKYGASSLQISELLAYGKLNFNVPDSSENISLPLSSEDHLAFWHTLEKPTIDALRTFMPQLHSPIHEGISQTEEYKAQTKKGEPAHLELLPLEEPENIELLFHQTAVGEIPCIITHNRKDFVSLVQAITARNEPRPVPPSMGACMVNGYINWGRVKQYKENWIQNNPEGDWGKEFENFIPQKNLYQDRFIILSDGPYSGVEASMLDHSVEEWKKLSLTVRMHHECSHYFTLRLLGSMQNNVFDEIIADFMGTRAALGHYSAKHFLTFLGLEDFPNYREGGRMQNYIGNPPLSKGSFEILQKMMVDIAHNLEEWDKSLVEGPGTPQEQANIILTLAALSPEEMTSPDAFQKPTPPETEPAKKEEEPTE